MCFYMSTYINVFYFFLFFIIIYVQTNQPGVSKRPIMMILKNSSLSDLILKKVTDHSFGVPLLFTVFGVFKTNHFLNKLVISVPVTEGTRYSMYQEYSARVRDKLSEPNLVVIIRIEFGKNMYC